MSRTTLSFIALCAGALSLSLTACTSSMTGPDAPPQPSRQPRQAAPKPLGVAPSPGQPSAVPIVPVSPIAPVAPAEPGQGLGLVTIPTSIDCAQPPQLQLCNDRRRVCREHQLEVNRFAGRWRLQCTPRTPADPIDGEYVTAVVAGRAEPGKLSRDMPECRDPKLNGAPVLKRSVQGDTTVIEVSSTRRAACRGGSEMMTVGLGLLKAGKYVVRSAHSTQSFTVRPASADPGDFSAEELARIEVARTQQIGQCFGMPPCDRPVIDPIMPFGSTRSGKKMAKLMPNLSALERMRLYEESLAVRLIAIAPGSWTYRYTDGQMCTSAQMEGQVQRQPNGSLLVTDPKQLSSKSIPC